MWIFRITLIKDVELNLTLQKSLGIMRLSLHSKLPPILGIRQADKQKLQAKDTTDEAEKLAI